MAELTNVTCTINHSGNHKVYHSTKGYGQCAGCSQTYTLWTVRKPGHTAWSTGQTLEQALGDYDHLRDGSVEIISEKTGLVISSADAFDAVYPMALGRPTERAPSGMRGRYAHGS